MLTGRIECVNVDAEVDRFLGPNSVLNLLDNTLRADGINNTGFHDLKPAIPVVLII